MFQKNACCFSHWNIFKNDFEDFCTRAVFRATKFFSDDIEEHRQLSYNFQSALQGDNSRKLRYESYEIFNEHWGEILIRSSLEIYQHMSQNFIASKLHTYIYLYAHDTSRF